MALPTETLRRWNIADGGTVEVADLGAALIIVPAGGGGFRSMAGSAIAEAGGHEALAVKVSQEGIVERIIEATDPWETDLGRLRADDASPKRVRNRGWT